MSSVVPKCGWRATVKPGCICYGSPQLVSQNLVRAAKSDRTPPCCLHSGFFFLSQKIQKRDPPPVSGWSPRYGFKFFLGNALGRPDFGPRPPSLPPRSPRRAPLGSQKEPACTAILSPSDTSLEASCLQNMHASGWDVFGVSSHTVKRAHPLVCIPFFSLMMS